TKAGVFSLPVTLIVLVIAFGALIAAGLPLLLALTAVLATMGLLALPSHLIPLDQDVSVVVLLIGLAVGVDYSLFYLKRAREERRVPFLAGRGRSERSGRVWSAVLDRVLRRPLVSIVVAGGLLLALAAPALHMRIAEPGIKTFPQNLSSIKTYNKLQKAFPGEANSSQVLVKTDDAHKPAVTTAIADLKRQAIATGQFSTPTHS